MHVVDLMLLPVTGLNAEYMLPPLACDWLAPLNPYDWLTHLASSCALSQSLILDGFQHLTHQLFSSPTQHAGCLVVTPIQATLAAMLSHSYCYLLLLLLQA